MVTRARVIFLATCMLVFSGVAVAGARTASHHDATGATGDNASRFLELTGDETTTSTVAGTASVAPAPATPDAGGDDDPVGTSPELDSVPRTPQGWALRPAGEQVDVLRFPLGLVATPDASSIVVSSDSGGVQGLTLIDAADLSAVPLPAANLFMGLAATPDGKLYASGGNADRVFRWQLAGPTALPLDVTGAQPLPAHNGLNGFAEQTGAPSPLPVGDGISVPGYPGAMALDGTLLYVAGTTSEPADETDPCPDGQEACSRVAVIDTATGTVIRRVPVGLDAFGLAIDATHHRLYVSNWADEAGRGGATGGTVSVVDISDPVHAHEIASIGVGHHPSALQLSRDGKRLFVADTNDDTITVLDVHKPVPKLHSVESVAPTSGTPVGAHPDAFALSPDGDTLFVALAGLNAVELRDGRTGARVAGAPVYIPTGWYPSALTVTGNAGDTGDTGGYRLWVANAKGLGPGPGANGSVFFQGSSSNGTVSAIDLPVAPDQIDAWSAQVVENDQLDRVPAGACTPAAGVEVSEVLCPPAGNSRPSATSSTSSPRTRRSTSTSATSTSPAATASTPIPPSPSTASRSPRTITPSRCATASATGSSPMPRSR